MSSSYLSPTSTWKIGSMCSSLFSLQSLIPYLAHMVLQKCLLEGKGRDLAFGLPAQWAVDSGVGQEQALSEKSWGKN